MQTKCDLVLLTWNNLKILKGCVDSILRYTRIPSRLIIVDNGSTEGGMSQYLSSLEGSDMIHIQIITNTINEGFARGMNKGIKSSNSPYVCLLNNDILVTNGWLQELIKVGEENSEVGIVNPSSNNFGLRFGKGTTLEEFAGTFKSQTGKWIEMESGIGFCMLVKREVINKIGYLAEDYGLAFFEDRDYSRRANDAGYKCVMARGCYVYHLGGRSVKLLKDKDRLFRRNAEFFYRRWGRPERIAYVITKRNEDYFKELSRQIGTQVKGHNRIWVFQKEGTPELKACEHLDVMLKELPAGLFKLNAFWNVVKKKKKFDRLYVDDAVLRKILEFTKWFHKAKVLAQ